MSNGVISNPTLVANQDIAKAQAVGAITTFMSQGTKTCDADGKNCRSVFGADDTPDYTTMQFQTQGITGVHAFSFGGDGEQDSNSITSQTGTLALACGDQSVKQVSGIAFKALDCVVNQNGDAKVTFQVCTAPARGNPVTQPDNAVQCSTDPSSPNFKAPPGKVCIRPACDTEPQGSLNGWSRSQTVSWNASLPASASEDQKTKNGLGLVFYPDLAGGVVRDLKADSDNMTAVKVVQSFINNETQRSAVGLKVAYRYKATVTKEMMVQGPSAVPNPTEHSAQWDTVLKLQGNAMIPQLQQKYASSGTECLNQIQEGIASDGVISVCDQNYTNESGIKPLAKTAQVAPEGQDCGTTTQCLQEVVNTNTWTQTCSADVPLAMRNCTTTQDYTMEELSYTRTRSEEQCTEKRFQNIYSCATQATVQNCTKSSVISQGGLDLSSTSGDANIVLVEQPSEFVGRYRIGTIGDNYWGSGYYRRQFVIDIKDKNNVYTFRMYRVGFDDLMAVAINDVWVWSDYNGGRFYPELNAWGKDFTYCASSDEYGCTQYGSYFTTIWERNTNWNYGVNVDFRNHLREGRNVLRIDTGVVGGGEGWIFLEISAWKMVCNYDYSNQCSTYEAAK